MSNIRWMLEHTEDCEKYINGTNACTCGAQEALDELAALEAVAEGVLICLKYPRGSEAQVRCLEEVGQDAKAALGGVK